VYHRPVVFYLCFTIIADTIAVALLGKARGFEHPFYLFAGLVIMTLGFISFSFATKTISASIANALWSGMSIALIVIVSKIFLGTNVTAPQYAFLLLIVVGVVGIHLAEKA